jgi:hypothetical protein
MILFTTLGVGLILFITGMFSISKLHHDIEETNYHWSSALEIGSRAGVILGLGLGLMVASIIALTF